MVPEQPRFPIHDECTYLYQTQRAHAGPDSLVLQASTDSPCSSNETLVDDDEHLQADIYKLILSPENTRSDDPDSPFTDRKHPSRKSSFNPHATPFVPLQGSLRGPPALVVQDAPTWLSSFWKGTTSDLPAHQILHAKRMLDDTEWTFRDICTLARRFSWQCTVPHIYASFARVVYDAFGVTHGTWESTCFRFYLQRSALESFNYALSNVPCRNDPSIPEEVDYHFRISCFVAELHAVELVSRSQMHQCFGRVLRNMHSPEHIQVLWEMVVRGKGTPWQGPGSEQLVADFVHFFSQYTQPILATTNFEHPGLVSTAAQASSIPHLIRGWHSQPSRSVTIEKSIWAYPKP